MDLDSWPSLGRFLAVGERHQAQPPDDARLPAIAADVYRRRHDRIDTDGKLTVRSGGKLVAMFVAQCGRGV